MTGIFHRQWWDLPLRKNPSQTDYSRPEKKRKKTNKHTESKPNQNQNQSTKQTNKEHNNSQKAGKDDQRAELTAAWRTLT